MTSADVETVRRTIELFNRGEIELALDATHPDFVMDWSNSIGPLKGVYRGRESVLALWHSFLEAWDSVAWEPEEITALEEGRVLVANRVTMRGKGSGVEVEARGVQIWTLRDGQGESIKLYQTRDAALADAG